ncbi:MAG: hypothetical protein JSV18_04130 [Candidatus Bathyarchaeota archaeon]|nr:MAG: hypothetical protein JSV18_04130 [Candidatus Bathyarchaeota archaeon]
MLFEASNEDRLAILMRLDGEAMNVTGLSHALGLTTQEASRHLYRLVEVGLATRDQEGLFHLTSYGRLVLKQMSGMMFTTRHRDYFASHSHESLPQEFLARLGELQGSNYMGDPMVSIYRIEGIVREAEEYVWSINFPMPMSVFPILRQAFDRGVSLRLMAPKDYEVHPLIKGALSREDQDAILRAEATGLMEERFLERMDIVIWMSEREVALIALPKPDGSFDLLGFSSEEERSHKWCWDLFQHYWERGEP